MLLDECTVFWKVYFETYIIRELASYCESDVINYDTYVAVRPMEMCYVIVLVEVLNAELLLILKAELAHAMLCSIIHRPLSSPLGYIISFFKDHLHFYFYLRYQIVFWLLMELSTDMAI